MTAITYNKFKNSKQIVWDTTFSTYYWKILLKPGERVESITGYSKAQGHQEKADKVSLLIRIVIMMRTKGYMKKATEIKFFRRDGAFIGDNDRNILTLQPDGYKLDDIELFTNKLFYDFLKNFYTNYTKGSEIDFLRPKDTIANPGMDEIYKSALNKSYKDVDHLHNHCIYLLSCGMAKGQVESVYQKVLYKNPELK